MAKEAQQEDQCSAMKSAVSAHHWAIIWLERKDYEQAERKKGASAVWQG